MNEPTIIIQGVTLDNFLDLMADRLEQRQNNGKEIVLNKTEACKELGYNFKTLQRAMQQLDIYEPLTNKKVDRIRKEYKKHKRI